MFRTILDADLEIGWHLATFCLYRRTAHSVPGGQGGCEYVRPLRESRLSLLAIRVAQLLGNLD